MNVKISSFLISISEPPLSMTHRAGLAIWSQTAIEGLWAACYGDPMNQPLFDLNLKRVTREHYITGKAAINFRSNDDTGGWHFLSHWNRESGVAKVSLAGVHYPDTAEFSVMPGSLMQASCW
ncbi:MULTISPECIES: hypothetical protein [Pseudomonas]|uniref:hypothetical protein n=1 Tax=Pseudomonas TaxID=286 RepID=UPI00273D531D|nr:MULTISPECIES: hypothetical protein [Pseudomonas]